MIKFRNVIGSLLAHQKFKTVHFHCKSQLNLLTKDFWRVWRCSFYTDKFQMFFYSNSTIYLPDVVGQYRNRHIIYCRFYEFHKFKIVKQLRKSHLKVNYYHWNTFKKANQKKTMVLSSSLPRLKHNSWFRSAEVTLFFHCSSHSPN